MYNPFRPHLVEFNNTWAIRKLTVIGWQYLGSQRPKPNNYWWSKPYSHYYAHPTEAQARQAYQTWLTLKQRKPLNVKPL